MANKGCEPYGGPIGLKHVPSLPLREYWLLGRDQKIEHTSIEMDEARKNNKSSISLVALAKQAEAGRHGKEHDEDKQRRARDSVTRSREAREFLLVLPIMLLIVRVLQTRCTLRRRLYQVLL